MEKANNEQAASVRRATSAAFRSDSRHASLDEALERVRAVAGRDLQRKSAGCVG